jgi:hypothetical protein
MNDVLNTYLNLGLLDIGDDDSRLSFLRAAATDLLSGLRRSRAKRSITL